MSLDSNFPQPELTNCFNNCVNQSCKLLVSNCQSQECLGLSETASVTNSSVRSLFHSGSFLLCSTVCWNLTGCGLRLHHCRCLGRMCRSGVKSYCRSSHSVASCYRIFCFSFKTVNCIFLYVTVLPMPRPKHLTYIQGFLLQFYSFSLLFQLKT